MGKRIEQYGLSEDLKLIVQSLRGYKKSKTSVLLFILIWYDRKFRSGKEQLLLYNFLAYYRSFDRFKFYDVCTRHQVAYINTFFPFKQISF